MKIGITHQRDPLMNYDITVTVDADTGETIAAVAVTINTVPSANDTPAPGTTGWEKEFNRAGQYPGDNTVEVIVTDQNGTVTRKKNQWTN